MSRQRESIDRIIEDDTISQALPEGVTIDRLGGYHLHLHPDSEADSPEEALICDNSGYMDALLAVHDDNRVRYIPGRFKMTFNPNDIAELAHVRAEALSVNPRNPHYEPIGEPLNLRQAHQIQLHEKRIDQAQTRLHHCLLDPATVLSGAELSDKQRGYFEDILETFSETDQDGFVHPPETTPEVLLGNPEAYHLKDRGIFHERFQVEMESSVIFDGDPSRYPAFSIPVDLVFRADSDEIDSKWLAHSQELGAQILRNEYPLMLEIQGDLMSEEEKDDEVLRPS